MGQTTKESVVIRKAEQIKFEAPYEKGYPYAWGYGVVSLTGRYVSHVCRIRHPQVIRHRDVKDLG